MPTYSGSGQFGGGYPSAKQQQDRSSSAMSNAIHTSGMANKNPVVPYRSTAGSNTLTPTGSPDKKQWGELNRQNASGKDIWGGTEISGLKFSGKTPQKSDYWHQMAEQPGPASKNISSPGASITDSKKIFEPKGSGASAAFGGSLGGGGGGMGRK